MNTFFILVPVDNSLGIAQGSGIVAKVVGEENGSGRTFQIDYEGNLYGASNLHTHWEKVVCAAGRSERNYPTRARLWLDEPQMAKHFRVVGSLDYSMTMARRDASGETVGEAAEKTAEINPDETGTLKDWAK